MFALLVCIIVVCSQTRHIGQHTPQHLAVETNVRYIIHPLAKEPQQFKDFVISKNKEFSQYKLTGAKYIISGGEKTYILTFDNDYELKVVNVLRKANGIMEIKSIDSNEKPTPIPLHPFSTPSDYVSINVNSAEARQVKQFILGSKTYVSGKGTSYKVVEAKKKTGNPISYVLVFDTLPNTQIGVYVNKDSNGKMSIDKQIFKKSFI